MLSINYSYRMAQWLVLATITVGLYWSVLVPWGLDLWEDPNYSHGMLIPFVALYLWHQRYEELAKAKVKESLAGILVIITALLLYVVGYVGAEFFTKRVSLIVLIYGMILYLEGKEVAKIMRLPVVMLFFSVPLPYILYNSIAFPLKLLASQIAVWILTLLGMPVFREGNIISLAHTTLEVVDACSGIRSLMTLITLAFLLACFQHTKTWKRIVILLLATPFAVLANAVRVASTGFLTSFDPKWGEGTFHDFTGWLVFVFSFLALALVSGGMKKIGMDEGERVKG